jgi:hypothetical protein
LFIAQLSSVSLPLEGATRAAGPNGSPRTNQ